MSVNIIGQDKLKSYINNTSIDVFPHAILLCGQQGSGRHLMCQYIAETKAIEAYTEASGVESLYAPQFKVLTEEVNLTLLNSISG